MANCPVDGSDKFLHLSCVTDDMMSIVYAPAFLQLSVRKCRVFAGEEWRQKWQGGRKRSRRVL